MQRMEETGAIKLNHENGGGIMKGGRVAAGKVVKPASGAAWMFTRARLEEGEQGGGGGTEGGRQSAAAAAASSKMISGEGGARRQDVKTRGGGGFGGGVQRVGKLVAVPMNSKSRETSEQREGGREGGRGELQGTLLPVGL